MPEMNTRGPATHHAQGNAPAAASPAAASPAESKKPLLIEVELQRKYCPHYLVQGDGSVIEQDITQTTQTIPPGVVRLHYEDAQHAMRAGIAIPTYSTFKELDRG
jgi:hypothetical protein